MITGEYGSKILYFSFTASISGAIERGDVLLEVMKILSRNTGLASTASSYNFREIKSALGFQSIRED